MVFQTDREIQTSIFGLAIFKLKLLCIFELNLNFGQKKTCRVNQGLQVRYLEFCPICNGF